MAKLLYDTLKILFAGGLINEISDFIGTVLTGLKSVMATESVSTMIGVFTAIAASLLTVYLYIHITEKVSQEMLSFEQLVLILIRYFIALVILIYLVDIITTLFNLAMGIYDVADGWAGKSNAFAGMQFFPKDGNKEPNKFPAFSVVKDAFAKEGWKDRTSNIAVHLPTFLTCTLISLISQVCKIASYFIVLGNAVSVIARTAFSPLGVVQLFNDGQRSAGIRYLKKLLAEALSFAAILGVLYAVSLLQTHVLAVQLDPVFDGVLSVENMTSCFKASVFGSICALQLTAVGAMFKAQQLANDIVGVS